MMTKMNRKYYKWIWLVLGIVLWEAVARLSDVSPLAFPSLVLVFSAMVESFQSGDLFVQIGNSLVLIGVGLLAAIVLSVFLSAIRLIHPLFDSLVETLISIFHPLPGIALLPVVILWIGIGSKAVIFIIIHSVLWPMTLNMSAGFQSLPVVYKKIAANYELALEQKIFRIYIPASFPYAIAGLKIGWARAWRAAISAEMIFGATGASGGVGWYLFNKRVFMDTPGLFAGLIVIVLIGILVEDLFFGKMEKNTIEKWGVAL
ncbi:MAG TPA: ABC transporter permease [Eubacteriaceae bacterium]|nr:ABC transporter permease [Eubacteriaceae bacterium]